MVVTPLLLSLAQFAHLHIFSHGPTKVFATQPCSDLNKSYWSKVLTSGELTSLHTIQTNASYNILLFQTPPTLMTLNNPPVSNIILPRYPPQSHLTLLKCPVKNNKYGHLLCALSSFANNKLPFPCPSNEPVLVVWGRSSCICNVVITMDPSSTQIHCTPPSQLHVDLVHAFMEQPNHWPTAPGFDEKYSVVGSLYSLSSWSNIFLRPV